MGENNSKGSNWQKTNLKNIQATPTAQLQKNKWPNQKMGQRTIVFILNNGPIVYLIDNSPKKTYRWLTNTWKDAQHHSLSEKCKSKPLWMLSFKPAVSLFSFAVINKLFRSSLLSALRVVLSEYLKLKFLQAVLSPACASSSLIFHMLYSAVYSHDVCLFQFWTSLLFHIQL